MGAIAATMSVKVFNTLYSCCANRQRQNGRSSLDRRSYGGFGFFDEGGTGGPPTVRQQHAFLDAAKRYDFSRVQALVLQNPGYVNCQPAGRWTALHQAASVGDTAAVRFLLAHGASVAVRTMDGLTPHEVAKSNVVEILFAAMPSPEMVEIPKLAKSLKCASEATIAMLPLSKFSELAAKQGSAGDMEDVLCQICLDEFSEGDDLRTLPCSHFFHTDCVDIWLLTKNCSCPVCRRDIPS